MGGDDEVGFVDPEAFARLVGEASDEDLERGFAANRELILAEVFRRMGEHYRGGPDVDAVVEWRIGGAEGGGHDRWQAVIRDGACRVVRDGDEPPRTILTVAPLDFIRLVTGNANGPELFLSGRLGIEGDLLFAAQVQALFAIPGGPPADPA